MLRKVLGPLLSPDGGAGGGAGGDGGAGGGTTSWTASLPEEMRSDPIIAQVPDVPTLAKNYINAQRMIGQKRLAAPTDKWTDKEWSDLYNNIGRPETPDKYTMPDVKFEEGTNWDADKLAEAKAFFHKQGLTDRQAKGLMEYYANVVNTQVKSFREKAAGDQAMAMETLKKEFGEEAQTQVDLAAGVLRKFGSPELLEHLSKAELGNNPGFIKAMASIGKAMMEDTARSGGGSGSGIMDVSVPAAAKLEIDRLKTDTDFMSALTKREHAGHEAAVARWSQLHSAAFPGKQA
jgi:hypothetical protein